MLRAHTSSSGKHGVHQHLGGRSGPRRAQVHLTMTQNPQQQMFCDRISDPKLRVRDLGYKDLAFASVLSRVKWHWFTSLRAYMHASHYAAQCVVRRGGRVFGANPERRRVTSSRARVCRPAFTATVLALLARRLQKMLAHMHSPLPLVAHPSHRTSLEKRSQVCTARDISLFPHPLSLPHLRSMF